jgi:hypothetical protein
MLYKDFYSELGKLLYAVADIDGVITKKEKLRLQDIVRKELAPGEIHRDKFGTDVAYYTEFEFDVLDEEIADAETAFYSFIDFVEAHRNRFAESMRKASIRITRELAAAYRRTNRKEKILLDILQYKLNNLDNPLRNSMPHI